MAHLTLKQHMESEDNYINKMDAQKFQKYWVDFSRIVAIAVILDPRYKIQFVDFCYKKLYGTNGSLEFTIIRDKLLFLINECVQNSATKSNCTSSFDKGINSSSVWESFSMKTIDVMNVSHFSYFGYN